MLKYFQFMEVMLIIRSVSLNLMVYHFSSKQVYSVFLYLHHLIIYYYKYSLIFLHYLHLIIIFHQYLFIVLYLIHLNNLLYPYLFLYLLYFQYYYPYSKLYSKSPQFIIFSLILLYLFILILYFQFHYLN